MFGFKHDEIKDGNLTLGKQQFGHVDAYGPMLQGFNKVVCDCSRGAPVSEIKGNIVISAARTLGSRSAE